MKQLSPKAQATREKILKAANDLFYLGGYNATGLDRIIAEAGVAKGNFYHHFKNKEELATAVLDWHRDLAFKEIELDHILAEPSPLKALLELVTRMTSRMMCDSSEMCRVRGCFFGNFALELSTGSEAVRLRVKTVFDGVRELIRDFVRKGQAAGEIRPELDPASTAGTILSLMEGAVLLDKTSQTRHETGNAIRFIREYLQRKAS
ncbi:MAG: TetR family transcriptional regulator [Gammaproteobacteria bacterium]|nr:TetR family transcriptional regulator [Gammaproteobacteria bacterium]